MKKLLLSLSILFSASLVLAQVPCNYSLPNVPASSYKVIDSNATHAGSGDIIWICRGNTVTINGSGNTIFCEKNVTLSVIKDDNDIRMKEGGNLTLTSVMNTNYDVHTSVMVTETGGSNNTKKECDPITYEYDDVPSAVVGCDIYAGIQTIKNSDQVKVFPNPATDFIEVTLPSNVELKSYKLYSASGKVVLTGMMSTGQNKIQLEDVQSGMYFVELHTTQGQITKRISVE